MANEIVIDVGANLKLVQSSVDAIKKTLDNLQPNSGGYKELEKILKSLEKEMTSLQVQTSKTFSSGNQFERANKSVDKIEESLIAAKLAMSKLDFKDLKLSGKSAEEFDNLVKNINAAEGALNKLKTQTFFQNLGKDAQNALKSIDPNYLLKDLNTIEKEVDKKLRSVNEKVAKAEQEQQQAAANAAALKANTYLSGRATLPELDKNKINTLMQRALGAGSGFDISKYIDFDEGKFKDGMKQPFYDFLAKTFQLDDNQLKQIQDIAAKNIQEVFAAIQKMAPEKINQLNGANTNLTKATQNLNALKAEQDTLADIQKTGLTIDDVVMQSDAYKELQQQVASLTQQLEQLKAREVDNARASEDLSKSTEAYQRGLQGMRDELQQTSTQFLKFQEAQRTFQNIKMAITNFFGFYQVLNLVKKAVTDAMNHIKELDKTMNAIAIVSNQTTADLWKQVDVYTQIAQTYGTTIQGAYEVSKIYYQAGYQTNEVLTLMNETLKLSKISGIDYAQTTDYMMTA